MTELRSFPFELKRLGGLGEVEGVAAAYGNRDRHGERILPGAFAGSLAEHKRRGTAPAMLLHHDAARPVGRWERFEETPAGLLVAGRLALDTPDGANAYALLKAGALSGLSVGFADARRQTGRDGIPEIVAGDLMEISFVTIPANAEATVTAVKAAPDVRTIEHTLRGLGFSQRKARAAAGAALRAAAEVPDAPAEIDRLSILIAEARAAIRPFAAASSHAHERKSK